MKKLFTKLCLLGVLCLIGGNAWAETVGTAGTGDAWASRKHSNAYEVKLGETRHFTFTNTSYGDAVWNNYIVECTNGDGDFSVAGDVASTYYFTLRADNYGWGDNYDGSTFTTDITDFKAALTGATVDLSVNFNETDKKVRTYAIITNGGKTYYRYNTSKAINESSVYISLSEELAVLNISTNELIEMPLIYSRTATAGQTNTWTNEDLTDWNAATGVAINEKGMGVDANQTKVYANKLFPIEDNSIINYSVDWEFQTSVGRTTNWNYIDFGNIRIAVNSSCNVQVSTDGGNNWSSTTLGYYYNTTVTKNITLKVNTATKQVIEFTFDGADKTNVINAAVVNNANNVKFGFIRGGSVSWPIRSGIKNITVSMQPQVVTDVDYEIHYQLSGTDVFVDSGTEADGNVITTERQITGNIGEYDGKRYYVIANELPSLKLDASAGNPNVLNVPVREPNTFSINVKAIGDINQTIHENVEVTEGDTYTFAIPAYIINDSKAYKANVGYYNRRTVTPVESGDVEITYNKVYDNVVKFVDLDVTEVGWSSADWGMQSNGSARDNTKFPNNEEEKIILAPGVYTVVANVFHRGRNCSLYVGDKELVDVSTLSKGKWHEIVKENVIVTEDNANNYVKLVTRGSTYEPLDYVFAVKTGDLPTNVSASVSAVGMATFCSPYNLDFTNTNKIKAYKGVVAGEKVTLTKVDQVKAGEGVLLYAEGEKTEDIPVTTDNVEPAVDNAFVGTLTNIESLATVGDDVTNYILNIVDGQLGFYYAAGNSVGAGKAYLQIPAQAGAAQRITISFSDETLIEAIKQAEAANVSEYYSVSGTKMQTPAKGINIVKMADGTVKKIMVK